MSPAELAALHALCFPGARAWDRAEFAALLDSPAVFLETTSHGFALGRVTPPEAELLTIAVAPPAQGRGMGQTLLARVEETARSKGAQEMFLEVAAGNAPARALYGRAAYAQVGRRKSYYRNRDGTREDALVFRKVLSRG